MTQEPDWADRAAASCILSLEQKWQGQDQVSTIAAALRRAKAEGLREAASLSFSLPDCIVLHARADLLDPPTPI